MYNSGLLVLTSPIRSAIETIGNHLAVASKNVRNRLYVSLEPGRDSLWPPFKRSSTDLTNMARFLPAIYLKASTYSRDLDIRVILSSCKDRKFTDPIVSNFDVILTDSADADHNLQKYVHHEFNKSCFNVMRLEKGMDVGDSGTPNGPEIDTYGIVVLGGTFDRLHNGHKVLLSSAVLRAKEKVVIGVTDGDMLKRKVLWELIEPVDKRIKIVEDFLGEIDPSIEYSVVPIYDVFGPTTKDPNMDCIVVSEETKRGGDIVNTERQSKNFKKLDMVVISLVEEPFQEAGDEAKVSSSNRRRALLGSYLKLPEVNNKQHHPPLRIAIIGELLSGKDLMREQLKDMGTTVIDLNDETYSLASSESMDLPDFKEVFKQGITKFRRHVTREMFDVAMLKSKNRLQEVSAKIFSRLKPVIEEKIQEAKEQGAQVVFLDMPACASDTWFYGVDHIWGTIVPEAEHIKQLKLFYHLEDEELENISKLSNNDIVNKSHVVFCHQSDDEFLKRQVEKAWIQLGSLSKNYFKASRY